MDVDYRNNYFTLNGNVSVNTKDYFMTADNLIYKKQEKTIMASGNIVIEFIKDKRRVNANTMIKDKSSTFFTGNPVRFVDFDKERTIDGNSIRIIKKDNDESIYVDGNVVITTDKMKIESEKIEYYSSQKIMLINGKSIIKKDDYSIKTYGIKYIEDEKLLIFDKETEIEKNKMSVLAKKGFYNEKEDLIDTEDVIYKKDDTIILSEKLKSFKSNNSNIYSFKGVREIKDKNMKGKTKEIEYDEKNDILVMKGDAFIQDTEKDLDIISDVIRMDRKQDKAFLVGSVNIRQKDKVITSSIGYYDKKNDKIVMTGNPIYKKGNDITYAQVIILDTKTNNVIMQGEIKGKFDIRKVK